MAVATYSVTTGGTDVNKIWRKVQGPLQQALQFDCEEMQFVKDLKKFEIDYSLREVTAPVDINEGVGIAAIAEGGDEAVPSTPNVEEITLSLMERSGRFTLSTQSVLLQKNAGAVIQQQMVYAGRKKMQDFARDLSDRFYGFTTGYLAQTTTVATASSGTAYTLANMYGVSGLGSAVQLADKFRVGDRVALIRSAALVTNAIGTITAISASTPSITVTWNGSVTSASGDNIVKANSMENTTITGTDYNHSIVGLLDAITSTSVHGLSSSSVANWSAAVNNSTAGRFTPALYIAALQAIQNYGGDLGSVVALFDQGVYRDVVSLQSAALRFSDPMALELSADIKAEGSRIKMSRRVPSGSVIIYDTAGYRRVPFGREVAPGMTDAIRMENKAGYIFPVNVLDAHVVTNRKRFVLHTGKTTS